MLKLELLKLHHFTYWGSFTVYSINFADLSVCLFSSIYKQTLFIMFTIKDIKINRKFLWYSSRKITSTLGLFYFIKVVVKRNPDKNDHFTLKQTHKKNLNMFYLWKYSWDQHIRDCLRENYIDIGNYIQKLKMEKLLTRINNLWIIQTQKLSTYFL